MKACQNPTPCGGRSIATPCGVIAAIKQSYNRIESFYKYSAVNPAGYNPSRKLKTIKVYTLRFVFNEKIFTSYNGIFTKISSIFERERERITKGRLTKGTNHFEILK